MKNRNHYKIEIKFCKLTVDWKTKANSSNYTLFIYYSWIFEEEQRLKRSNLNLILKREIFKRQRFKKILSQQQIKNTAHFEKERFQFQIC